jgi:hypothetical protein
MSWRLGNYQIKISNRFAALENLSDSKDTKENIKISVKQSPGLFNLKQHKPWFDEECLYFLDQRKHAKMQWVQDPNQNNVDNLNNVRRDPSTHFRNKNKEYLKAKFIELETNSKIKNIRDVYRGINDFKMGYQPRAKIVWDEKGDLVTDSHSILARWRNHFSQLISVHGVNVRQTEKYTSEPLVAEPSAFKFEMVIEELKRHKSSGIDQIPAELIKAGGRTIPSEIQKLISFIWNKEELPEECKEYIILPMHK